MSYKTEGVIEKVGNFGLFQIKVCGIVGYSAVISTLVLLVMTFSTAEPAWRCKANTTSCTLNGTFSVGDKHYEHRCDIPRSDWEFAVDGTFNSIVTEWDLVCGMAVYTSIVNSLTFVLWIFGSMIASVLSDKYGRKTMVFPFALIMYTAGLLSAFAQKYWVFAVFRSLVGAGLGGLVVTRYILVMEYVGAPRRGIVGIGIFYFWVTGLMLLSLLGYLIPDWRTLTIVTSAPGFLLFIFWRWTPESLRWLLTKGKIDAAMKILKEAARVNGKNLSDEDFVLEKIEEKEDEDEQKKRMGDFRDLFATRSMMLQTLISWFCWCTCGMVYYGIVLGSPTIGGNMYLNFFISAVCEAIAMVIGIVCLDKFGRKKTIAASLWIAGVAMMTSAVLDLYDDGSDGYLAGKILMAMVIGRFFIIIAFDGVFLHTSELFPTIIRNTAIGSTNSMARIGSGLSPFLLYTQRIHPLMTFGIMAVFALVGGILFLALPETLNQAMPDVVELKDDNDNQGNINEAYENEAVDTKL